MSQYSPEQMEEIRRIEAENLINGWRVVSDEIILV